MNATKKISEMIFHSIFCVEFSLVDGIQKERRHKQLSQEYNDHSSGNQIGSNRNSRYSPQHRLGKRNLIAMMLLRVRFETIIINNKNKQTSN